MLANTTYEPPADFADPRLEPGFKFRLWPLCNGGPGPEPDTRGLYQRRCLEFLAAFYQLNVANRRLLDARKARASKKVIKSCLDDVASATSGLEAIEDRYAPIGFFGEPVMDGIRYQNIVFISPEVPKQYPQAPKETLIFGIPGLETIPKSELRGQAKLRRFGDGRLDL